MGKFEDFILDFGKYKGEWLTDAPIYYLKWLKENGVFNRESSEFRLIELAVNIYEDGGNILKYIRRAPPC